MVTIIGQYLIYETFHYCCHVRDNWFVRYTPFVNTIRRHHSAHHNYGIMMSHNMNLTFPIADWLMGTSDVDRGLLGTCSTATTKATCVPSSSRPSSASADRMRR